MEKFIIHGGKPLEGEIDVGGAKNAAFPVIAASILTTEDVTISNLPLIEDVFRLLEILEHMGARVEWKGERKIVINTASINPKKIDRVSVKRFRGSVLLLGPLLARFQKIYLPQPGGCYIGTRPIDTHLDAFEQLGVTVKKKKEGFELSLDAPIKEEKEVILNEFSVTATENILLFAALQEAPVAMKIADYDYQVQELARVLNKMGANVKLSGLHELSIKGKPELKGVTHRLMYDPTEAGTFILLAAIAKGEITVKNVEVSYLDLFLKKLRQFGVQFDVHKKNSRVGDVTVHPSGKLKMDKLQCFIYPGIHSDLQSPLGILATQTSGSTLLHDPLYSGRLKYLEEINKMGGEIYMADPHRAIINGPTRLYGAELSVSDLRGGAALIAAALIAEGRSTISNIYQVDRGYERIDERLRKIGADIQRVNE